MKREARVKEHEAETERQLEERPIQKIKEKPYITITETALFVGVSRPTIYGYLRRGELQAKRIGSKYFLIRDEVSTVNVATICIITMDEF